MKSKTIYDNPTVIKPPSLESKQSISVPRQRNTTKDLESIQEDYVNKQNEEKTEEMVDDYQDGST